MEPIDPVHAANALTAAWLERHDDGPTAVSGAGVWVLLAALLGGAAGDARDELSAAVGLPSDAALPAVRSLASIGDDSAAVRAALGVWVPTSVPLDERWVAALPFGMVGALTGDLSADQEALDRWVAESTDGLLQSLPLELTAETLLVLASALSVRTKWATPFEPSPGTLRHGAWTDQPGVLLRRSSSDVDEVSVAGDVTLLRVEGEDDVDVYLVLGPESSAPGAVVAAGVRAVSADPAGVPASELPLGTPGPGLAIDEIQSATERDRLRAATVAFAVTASHDLLEHASLFGLQAARSIRPGHFPGVSSEPLAVDQAAQDVMAEFTHEGFVAAAVTAVSMLAGAAPPRHLYTVREVRVVFDRPFGFVAVHRSSRLVLVAGWVTQPSPPDTPAEQASPS